MLRNSAESVLEIQPPNGKCSRFAKFNQEQLDVDAPDKLLELKDTQDKIHDESLLPEKGIRFAV